LDAETAQTSAAYRVRAVPARHEIEVEMLLEGPAAEGPLRLEVPTWVPGDYEFQPFGRDLFDVKAADPRTGGELAVTRAGWQAYHVEGAAGAVRVNYTAYCSSTDFGEPCGILDDRYGILLGTRYLFTPAHRGPCRITYEIPEGWGLHHPSGARRDGEWSWEYPSYEVLLDTPVVMGAFDLLTREVKGTTFYFIFVSRGVGFESQVGRFVDSLARVAVAYHEQFGSFPFADYTFILSLNPTDDWGLEHLTSTMVGLGPDVFIDPEQYATGVRGCAHEMFHAWNVRRLRPAPLDQLDFYRGSFTEGLWMAEGFTRYYEFLVCTRTGIYTPQEFFSAVVNYYGHLSALPAYMRVSALDSSAASYLNHDSAYPGRVNNSIDYYDKGMLIAFGLDVTLRSGGDGGSLDRAFVTFYEEYVGRGPGYTTAEVCDFFGRLSEGLGERLSREVSVPGGLALAERLREIGFETEKEKVAYFGLVMQDGEGPAVYGVLDTGPAGQSGIAPEDVVTTVNGYPYSLAALKWVCANEGAVRLGVLRGNQPRTYEFTAGESTRIGRLTWAGTDEQAARIAAWLGQPFEPSRGQDFPLDFYENFHGVKTVI
jgi:predicted metalloprotease with PDZ domain